MTGASKYDSESEDDSGLRQQSDIFALTTTSTTTNNNNNNNSNNHKPPAWTTDPDLPYVASGYVQLVFNMFRVGVALYIGLAFIQTIQRDVNQKVEEYSTGIATLDERLL